MRSFRTYHQVDDPAGAEVLAQVTAQAERLAARMAGVQRVWLVASGKGGVGKSAVTANLAAALAARGHAVGALDADLNGPSLAAMLAAARTPLRVDEAGVHPAAGVAGTRVMSTDLLLASPDAPLRWRGPDTGAFVWQSTLEAGALREFLSDVAWGELDHLLLDLPPGTDKLLRALELLPAPAGVLIVTTPSTAALSVVRRSLRLVRDAGVERIGVVANMAAWRCGACGAATSLFDAGDDAVAALAAEMGVPVWAEVPFDPRLARRTDAGEPLVLSEPDTPAARALLALADRLEGEP
ncbi:MAG TPA: P-loop NTPase [Longimicrobiales bacterium]|nr:P-loop NTPase [Longimicrobiales bacterium]